MRLHRFDRPEEFLRHAGPYLERDEARSNLPLAVARTCRDDPGRYPGPNILAVVEEGDRVVGVVLRTHPYQLQYYAPAGAAEAVAEELRGEDLPGVHGPEAECDAFARAWGALRGIEPRIGKRLRSFRLDAVLSAPPVTGGIRTATASDLPLATAWYRAFEKEAEHGAEASDPGFVARRTMEAGRLHLWEDGGRVVAMAGVGASGPESARVGPVYTPPDARRRGYATALTAALSARLLAEGKRCCYLFTDLANPISNSIYPKVGYRPVADFREWNFRPAPRKESTRP